MRQQALTNRNEIARMLTLGAGQPKIVPQQPSMAAAAPQAPPAPIAPVAYKEAGFGYGADLSPMEEIGQAWWKRK